MDSPMIIFPGLGITIQDLSSGFDIGSFHIAYYGVIIAAGMILGSIVAILRAKKTNQYSDNYIDVAIITIIAAIIGARIYYVLFSLDDYKDNLLEIFNIRGGGLAIYGGVIGGCIAAFFVSKYKKINLLRILDTCAPGIILAQAIGRWGNFFNREAYGGYTESLFAMQIRLDAANGGTQGDVLNHIVDVNGVSYIQVHPTFLYESAWCLLVFILIMVFSKLQQYNGEVLLWYLGGYALERAFVEGLRTDQLRVGTIAVSQLLSVMILAGALTLLIINRVRIASGNWEPDFHLVLEDGEPGTKGHYDAIKAERKAKNKKKNPWEIEEVESEEKTEDASGEKTEDTSGKNQDEESVVMEETETTETTETTEAEVVEAESEVTEDNEPKDE